MKFKSFLTLHRQQGSYHVQGTDTFKFIQSDLQVHIFEPVHIYSDSGHIFIVSMRVPWDLNPQPFALLTQCPTTEPREHIESTSLKWSM